MWGGKSASQQAVANPVWPIPEDSPELEDIVAAQAKTISEQEVLIHEYQGVLNAAQNPPSGSAATGSGTTTGSSTSVTITGANGTIAVGSVVSGAAAVPTGTKVLGQISGTTGGNGVYLFDQPVTLATATMMTFTPPPPASTWPVPGDSHTLTLIAQQQTTVLRQQNALIQAYQDLLNSSETPAPM